MSFAPPEPPSDRKRRPFLICRLHATANHPDTHLIPTSAD